MVLHHRNLELRQRISQFPSATAVATGGSAIAAIGLAIGLFVGGRKVAPLQRSAVALNERLQTLERTSKLDARAARLAGVQSMAVGVIDVTENLARGLEMAEGSCKGCAFNEGVKIAEDEFRKHLERNNVVNIVPEVNQEVDPNVHQVVAMTPVEECKGGVDPGNIAELVQSGWKLEERILRPATVVVANRKAVADTEKKE